MVYEGELGIVIGKTCSGVGVDEALDHVFGYTCANDVTVAGHPEPRRLVHAVGPRQGLRHLLPDGPVVATGLDPASLIVTTTLNGELRQNYPISDMRFPVRQLVSLISQDLTLMPGDVILCGTSVGVGSMKPDSRVEIAIEGIGRLGNRFV